MLNFDIFSLAISFEINSLFVFVFSGFLFDEFLFFFFKMQIQTMKSGNLNQFKKQNKKTLSW